MKPTRPGAIRALFAARPPATCTVIAFPDLLRLLPRGQAAPRAILANDNLLPAAPQGASVQRQQLMAVPTKSADLASPMPGSRGPKLAPAPRATPAGRRRAIAAIAAIAVGGAGVSPARGIGSADGPASAGAPPRDGDAALFRLAAELDRAEAAHQAACVTHGDADLDGDAAAVEAIERAGGEVEATLTRIAALPSATLAGIVVKALPLLRAAEDGARSEDLDVARSLAADVRRLLPQLASLQAVSSRCHEAGG